MIKSIDLLTPTQRMQSNGRYHFLDARPLADYLAGHIPGARPICWEDWCEPAPAHAGATLKRPGYWGTLQDAHRYDVAARLAALGLDNQSPIVVYADGPRSKGREGRIAWMLLYWGAQHIFLLDGGWSHWLACGGSCEYERITCARASFTVRLCPERRVSLAELKEACAQRQPPLLIDTRTRAEFVGQSYAYQPRLGHISGALHWPFTSLFDEHGCYVSRETYLAMLARLVGTHMDWLAYCEVGVRSCVLALLHEHYTGQIIRNFDASLMAWGLDETLTMKRG